MKLREGVGALCLQPNQPLEQNIKRISYQIGIPHSDRILDTDFSHQQAIHPPERKLHEFDVLGLQVRIQRCWINRLSTNHLY